MARAKQDAALAVHAVAELTGPHGSPQFDQRTKSKTVEALVGAMTPDQLRAHVAALREQVLQHVATEAPAAARERPVALSALAAVMDTDPDDGPAHDLAADGTYAADRQTPAH